LGGEWVATAIAQLQCNRQCTHTLAHRSCVRLSVLCCVEFHARLPSVVRSFSPFLTRRVCVSVWVCGSVCQCVCIYCLINFTPVYHTHTHRQPTERQTFDVVCSALSAVCVCVCLAFPCLCVCVCVLSLFICVRVHSVHSPCILAACCCFFSSTQKLIS